MRNVGKIYATTSEAVLMFPRAYEYEGDTRAIQICEMAFHSKQYLLQPIEAL